MFSQNRLLFWVTTGRHDLTNFKEWPTSAAICVLFRGWKNREKISNPGTSRKKCAIVKHGTPLRPNAHFCRWGAHFLEVPQISQNRRFQKIAPLCGDMRTFSGALQSDKSPNGDNCRRSPLRPQNGNQSCPETRPTPSESQKSSSEAPPMAPDLPSETQKSSSQACRGCQNGS